MSARGAHRLTVSAPEPEEPLMIMVGRALSTREAMLGGLTGKGDMFKRG